MKAVFSSPSLPKTGVVVVGVLEGRKLTTSAVQLDKSLGGAITRGIKASNFKGTKGQSLTLLAPGTGKVSRVLAVGLGKAKEINDLGLQSAGGSIYGALNCVGATTISVLVGDIEGCTLKAAEQAAEIAFGARLRSYRFDKYRTKEKKENKPVLKTIQIQCTGNARAKALYMSKDKIADGVFLTRDLVSEPANVLYPETLAQQARALSKVGIKVEVLNESQMAKLGMGALLGVGQGSIRESRLVVMRWNGAGKPAKGKKAEAPIAFVGKGVT
ncbi:MAG: leucyl aminopeptidase family protein, partial [Rhodospirillales bacterium]